METPGGNLESTQEQLEREWNACEERLQILLQKKFVEFNIDRGGGSIVLKFEDGSSLRFRSWDAYYDVPSPENIEVNVPNKSTENLES